MTGQGGEDGDSNGWDHLTDAESLDLVKRFQAGDRSAFERLYVGWARSVFAFIVVAIRNRARAEDLTQDVFVSALASLEEFEPQSEGAFRAWLFQIARNKIINVRQKENRFRVQSLEGVEAEALGVRDLELGGGLNWLTDPDLLTLVKLLPETQRLALFLRFCLEMSAGEVAQVMDRTRDDIHQLHHRALRHLAVQLEKTGRRDLRRRRSGILKRIKPLPVLGARRFALENSLRPLPVARSGFSATRGLRW